MAFTYTKLTEVGTVPQSATSIYANPSLSKTFVASLIVHNWGTTNRDLTLNSVPASGAVSTSNQWAKITVVPNETVFIEPKSPLVYTTAGDALYALASGGGVNLQVLGNVDA